MRENADSIKKTTSSPLSHVRDCAPFREQRERNLPAGVKRET